MLIDVRAVQHGQPCAILGTGRTASPEKNRYSNPRFALEILTSQTGWNALSADIDVTREMSVDEILRAVDEKFIHATGIVSRHISPGSAADLGAEAARNCLQQAFCLPSAIDAIIVGTNTGSGYPSTADRIKALISAPTEALCFDVQEACPVGAVAVYLGWQQVRLGAQRVLVIGAEKATTLASLDDYKAANLFGDAAFALLLGPGWRDSFTFFAFGSDPMDGKAEYILRTKTGFRQNGPAVHEFVGTVVPADLARIFEQLQLDAVSLDHFFPHQPSAKTLNFLIKNLRRKWPGFHGTVHRNVEEMGNTSGACTGWMIDRANREGLFLPHQNCLVATFGSGLSWGYYGFVT